MKTQWKVLATGFLMFLASGCAHSTLRTADRGIVAIPANNNAWPFRYRERAEKIMASHFPNGYEIVREEEAIVGETVNTHEDFTQGGIRKSGPFSVTTGSSHVTTTKTNQTEWHIHYRRVGGTRPVGWSEPANPEDLSLDAK